MIPSPNTASLVKAPPENRLRYEMTPPLLAAAARDWTALKSTPGADDVVAQPVHRDDEQGEQDLVAQVRDSERGS